MKNSAFKSFISGGFECAYAKDHRRVRIDLLAESKHDIYCRQDYKLLKDLGIYTVREGLSWYQIDKGNGVYDFSRFEAFMQIGKEEGIQQIWDLNHFDYPERLDPFSEEFVNQFGEYASKAIKVIRKYQKGTIYIVPVNEISFFSFIGGDVEYWAPYAKFRGGELKKQFVKAAIKAMDSIWEVDNDVRFIHVDPIMYRTTKKNASESARNEAAYFNEIKYEAWDMISGKKNLELGGNIKYLDIIGLNYYFANQEWVLEEKDEFGKHHYWGIPWHSTDRISFTTLIKEVYERYKRPIFISETGSHGELRVKWWKRVLKEVDQSLNLGIPVLGLCAYPVIGRHDWNDGHLTNSGLWDFDCNDKTCKRIPHVQAINIIKKYLKASVI